MKPWVKTALQMGLWYGTFMGFWFAVMVVFLGRVSWQTAVVTGVTSGLGCGVAFGLAMSAFLHFARKRLEVRGGKFESEDVLYQGPGNHYLNGEHRGGWLVLTPTRLAFRTHGRNFQNQRLYLPLATVVAVKTIRTLGLVPNGLRMDLADGASETFVVRANKEWCREIEAALGRDRHSAR